MRRIHAVALGLALALTATAAPAWAVDYRLQVISMYENSFASFLTAGELKDGSSGPGLARLEASLDKGEVSKAVLLYDRHLQASREGIARAYGGVPVRAEVRLGGLETDLWDEVRWEGKPGEQSVWVIVPGSRLPQELRRLALKGFGPLRQFQPYVIPANGTRFPAVSFPLNFLWTQEELGTAWGKYVRPVLDLRDGIGAIVAVNHNRLFPDQVYVIVSQGAEPTTYKAVLAWRQRPEDVEGPSRLRKFP